MIFIDYDKYVGDFQGRYCEPGVDESTSESNTRTGLMFYELKTYLNGWIPSPWKRSSVPDNWDGTFEGDINAFAYVTLNLDPNAELTSPYVENDSDSASSLSIALNQTDELAAAGDGGPSLPNLLPDG